MTETHIKYAIFQMARHTINNTMFRDSRVKNILELLTRVYALKELLKDSQALYELNLFSLGSSRLLKDSYNALLLKLRPQMIPLVEIQELWQEDTWMLSTIGNKYGDIYEKQLEVAQNSRLNQSGGPPPYYERLMKPLI
jgi:hypothetical protein